MTQRQFQGNTLLIVSDSVEKQHICPSAYSHFELNIMKEKLLQGPQCYFVLCVLSLSFYVIFLAT